MVNLDKIEIRNVYRLDTASTSYSARRFFEDASNFPKKREGRRSNWPPKLSSTLLRGTQQADFSEFIRDHLGHVEVLKTKRY